MNAFSGSNKIVSTLAVSFSLQFIGIVTGIITARILGPTGKGQLTAILLWPTMLASIGNLGMVNAVTYFTSTRADQRGQILSVGIMTGIAQSTILVAIGWFLIPKALMNQGAQVVILCLIYLFFIPLNLLTLYQQGIFAGLQNFKLYNLIRISYVAFSFLGIVYLAISKTMQVNALIIVYLLSNLSTFILTTILTMTNGNLPGRFHFDLAASMLKFGLLSNFASIFLLINERLDQLFISIKLDSLSLGYYAVAVTIASPVALIGSSIAMVALPVVSRENANEQKVNRLTQYSRLNIWLSLLFVILIITIIPLFVNIFYGKAYIQSIPVAMILVCAAFPLSINRVLESGCLALNKPSVPGVSEFISIILTGLGLMIFLPKFGIIGAGLVSATAYSVSTIFLVGYLNYYRKVKVIDLLIPHKDDFLAVRNYARSVKSSKNSQP